MGSWGLTNGMLVLRASGEAEKERQEVTVSLANAKETSMVSA